MICAKNIIYTGKELEWFFIFIFYFYRYYEKLMCESMRITHVKDMSGINV